MISFYQVGVRNIQILSGKLPFLTRGPYAVFFGGDKLLPEFEVEDGGDAYLTNLA